MLSKTMELGICLRYSCMLEIEDGCERGLKVDLLVDERVRDQQTWRSQLLAEGSRPDLLCGRGTMRKACPLLWRPSFVKPD
jgi:hypothetical protein